MNRKPWRVLGNRVYTPFFISSLISSLGDYAGLMAVYVLVAYRWQASPLEISILGLSTAVPYLISSSLAGVFVDRFDRRRLMILADLGRTMIVLGLIVAPSTVTFYALFAARAVLSAIFDTSRVAAIPQVVPEADLVAANGMDAFAQAMMKVLGPAVGGMLAASVGPHFTFGLDAASFAGSAVALVFVPALHPPQAAESSAGLTHARAGFWQEYLSGLRQLAKLPAFLVVLSLVAAASFAVQLVDPQLPLLARDAAGPDVRWVSWTLSAIGLGLGSGALTTERVTHWWRPFAVLRLGMGLMGFALLGYSLVGFRLVPVWVMLVCGYITGLALPLVSITFRTVLQTKVPREILGRVAGTSSALIDAVSLAAPALGGLIATAWGVPLLFVLSAALILVLTGGSYPALRARTFPDSGTVGHHRQMEPPVEGNCVQSSAES